MRVVISVGEGVSEGTGVSVLVNVDVKVGRVVLLGVRVDVCIRVVLEAEWVSCL